MSHRTIKDGIVGILNAQGYSEASTVESYEDVSAQEYGNTFILSCVSGEQEEASKALYDRAYDNQTWEITFAFDRSSNNDAVNRDVIHSKKDALIAALDKPSNWTSFARMMTYESWDMRLLDSYFLITMTVKVTDVFTY